MANEIDELMDRDPLELSSQDIDAIIAYQRKHRANVEGGVKVKKADGPKRSLQSLLDTMIKKPIVAGPKVQRRV